MFARCDQNGITCRNDHEIRGANDCGEHSFGVYKTVPTVHHNATTERRIAVLIAGQYLPDCVPTADVGPSEAPNNDCDIASPLDDGIIDRCLGGCLECHFIELHETLIRSCRGDRA